MKKRARLAVYGVVGAVLLIAVVAAPSVWATPGQSGHAQTVPTRTATAGPIAPTDPPPASTPVPTSPATVQPGTTVVPPTSQPAATRVAAGGAPGLPPLELPVTGGFVQP